MKRLELFFTSILVPSDIIAIILAFTMAYFWRSEGQTMLYLWPLRDYLKFSIIFLPLWLIVFSNLGLYRAKYPKRGWDEFTAIILAVIYSVALLTIVLYFIRSSQTEALPRRLPFYIGLLAIVLVTTFRWFIHWIQGFYYRQGLGVHRILLIGRENGITHTIHQGLQQNRRLGYDIVESITPEKLDNLAEIQRDIHFDDIILTDSNLAEEKVLMIIRFCEDHNLGFHQVPNIFEVKSSHIQLATLSGLPIIEFRHTPLEGWGHIAKRIFDIIGSIISLIVFAIPMLVVTILVKLTSRGPILYKHPRVGLDGCTFNLYKFRTMKIEFCRGPQYGGAKAEKYFQELMNKPEYKKQFDKDYKLKNDPRITSIGHFLRQSSLDELPQFFNVFRGDISLVGPRPIVREEMSLYGAYQNKRHIIKPGLTGLWQVSGRNDLPYHERIKLDLFYLENWSLWLDVSIIAKTAVAIIKKNTY